MRYSRIVCLAVLLLAIPTSSQAESPDDEALAIAHLAFRDQIVTISSSPRGLRYSVRTTSGKLISEDLTEDQLLAAHPKLHSHIRSSQASDGSGSFIWAGRSEDLIAPAANAVTNSD
jgi:hypothetical protein